MGQYNQPLKGAGVSFSFPVGCQKPSGLLDLNKARGAFLTRHSSRAVEGPGPVTPPQPIRRDTVRKPGSMEVKAVSKKDEGKKDEAEGELPLEPGMAVIMTVPPGMAKRLRERNARRKAEREAREKESGKKEDGADE